MLKHSVVINPVKKHPVVSYETAKKEGGVFNEIGTSSHDLDFVIFTQFGNFYYNGCAPSSGLQELAMPHAENQKYRKADVSITVTFSNT